MFISVHSFIFCCFFFFEHHTLLLILNVSGSACSLPITPWQVALRTSPRSLEKVGVRQMRAHFLFESTKASQVVSL